MLIFQWLLKYNSFSKRRGTFVSYRSERDEKISTVILYTGTKGGWTVSYDFVTGTLLYGLPYVYRNPCRKSSPVNRKKLRKVLHKPIVFYYSIKGVYLPQRELELIDFIL